MSNLGKCPARILIVDDHPIVRQGYALLIANEPDLEVCGLAGSLDEAVQQARAGQPALAIIDITLDDGNGIELVKELLSKDPLLRILVISAHDENVYAERALDAGALGYVSKKVATERLVDAIRAVLGGDVFVSDEVTHRLLKRRVLSRGAVVARDGVDVLTDRELEVFELIGHGKTTKQIASRLQLSPKTIERYKENIKRKLQIENATELVQRATRWMLEER